jgi:hypothetical protein
MSNGALGRYRPWDATALIATLVVAVGGCASASNLPQTNNEERNNPREVTGTLRGAAGALGGAAVGAVGGAAVGALYGLTCGPAAIICSPVGFVLGGAYGIVKGAQSGARWGENAAGADAGAGANTLPNANADVNTEVKEGLVYIGYITASDFSPPGRLFVDTGSVSHARSGANLKLADGTLVVNLDNTADRIKTSMRVEVSVTCETGEVGFGSRRTYDGWDGEGQLMSMEKSTTALVPGSAQDAVVRTLCTQESPR